LSLERRWFVEPSALFQIRAVPQFQDGEQVSELRVRSIRYGGAIGREIGNSAELRFGGEREIGKTWVRLGDTTQPDLSFQFNEVFARYSYDDLDSAAFPRRGEFAELEWRGQVSDRSLERVSDSLRMDLRVARSWEKNTVVGWLSAGTLLDAGFADERSYFPLGGFLNLSGVAADSVIGPHYGIARLIYYRKVGSGGEGFLNVPLYAGLSVEAGNAWEHRREMSLSTARKNTSVFFGLDTFLGPAWFAVGYDSRGRHAFYLSLGRGF
jgi:NTE family protein